MELVLKYLYGRLRYQSFFERLLVSSMKGLNFYNAGVLKFSGEKNLLKILKDDNLCNSQSPVVIFDVGACTGEYSSYIRDLFSDVSIEIHLFEPTSSYLESLDIEFNEIPFVYVNKYAIGKSRGETKLHCCTDRKGINSIYDRQRDFQKNKFDYDLIEDVRIDTIDNYCNENNVRYINFLKIDTEGNEFDCLIGARRLLDENKIYSLLFEFGGANVDAKTFFYDFWTLLKERFDIFRVAIDGIRQIHEYNRTLELFISVNYFARLKPEFTKALKNEGKGL